jgi:hypothetical protein
MQVPPIELEPGEKIMAEVLANLFRGWEAVGGKLYITDRRIRFESHRWNARSGPTEIPLREVRAVAPIDNLGYIPNGMLVETEGGMSFRFVVWRRQRLMELIQTGVLKAGGGQNPYPHGGALWDRELDGNL